MVPLRVLNQKSQCQLMFALELVPLRGQKNFEPRPQNRALVPLRDSFQNFRRALPSFFLWDPHTGVLVLFLSRNTVLLEEALGDRVAHVLTDI